MISADDVPLKVYWKPGCTSCLRTKEYLTRNGVPFVSINAVEDEEGFQELERLGIKRVPIVRRGDGWVDGQVLADVARIAGIRANGHVPLPPGVLVERGSNLLSATRRFILQIPDDQLDILIPHRPRSYRQLAFHALEIYQFYLDWAEIGRRLELVDYANEIVPDHIQKAAELDRFGAALQNRLMAWWKAKGQRENYSRKAGVYYGEQTMHEFLERTVWHSGQHTRQLQLVVEKLGFVPDGPLSAGDIDGLPMPTNVFDDQLPFN